MGSHETGVRGQDEMPLSALSAWAAANAPAVGAVCEVEKFPGGFSNLTYKIAADGGTFVVRRAPRGVGPGVAHDMAREYRILQVLAARGVAAPKPVALCEDASVVGAPFYIMERVQGVILRGAPDPVPAPEVMRGLSERFVQTLVSIHSIGPDDPAIAALGKGTGYVSRQVGGWTARWEKSRTEEVPAMEELAVWIASNQPADSGSCLVHNDFKYDNLVLSGSDLTQIVGVLDWEMATLGDPLLDVGTTLGYWVEASDHPAFRALGLGSTALPGNYTRAEVWARYLALTGREFVPAAWYRAFGMFKIAVIAQQIYARYVRGLTSDMRFSRLGQAVQLLGETALREAARS